MADWPGSFVLPDPLIHVSPMSMCAAQNLVSVSSYGAFASAAWPSANRAVYVPFILTRPYVVSTLFVLNGATASGNLDLALYSEGGVRLISTGSQAQVGTSVIQSFSIAATELGVGLFYLAMAMDNGTGTAFRSNLAATSGQLCGLATQAAAFALPASATFATPASGYLPLIGATGRSFV